MPRIDDAPQLTASDLVGHLNCRHLTDLDVAAASGGEQPPHFHDPVLQILTERGDRHEHDYLQHLTQAGHEILGTPAGYRTSALEKSGRH